MSSTQPLVQPLDTAMGSVEAVVEVPGSKSISNRALICASLASGTSHLTNLASGDDTRAMIDSLSALGIPMQQVDSSITVEGSDGRLVGGVTVDARLAGTTSRFLTAMGCLAQRPTTVTGELPLLRRPMQELHQALENLGAHVRALDVDGRLPVEVHRGAMHGGHIALRGDISSQFLSALMLIAPYLEEGLRIELTSKLVSRPYVELTKCVMEDFGATEIRIDDDGVLVGPTPYRATSYHVEPDASSASYPLAAAAISGGSVFVEGLFGDSKQGDIRILDILEAMGCAIVGGKVGTGITRSGDLVGIDIDMADVSDLVPTVAAVALFASTPTRITGVGFIRSKESDRVGDLVNGLKALGGNVQEHEDGLEIHPTDLSNRTVRLSTHHDHRLAMAWSLIALRRGGISLDDPATVAKSWPNWWNIRDMIVRSSIK